MARQKISGLSLQSSIFSLENVSLILKSRPIFNKFSMTFGLGAVSIVMGNNGSGKTTLLRLLRGIYTESSGTIFYRNQITTASERYKNGTISFMGSEGAHCWPELTVRENFLAAAGGRGLASSERDVLWDRASKEFQLSQIAEKKYRFCSSGEQKMVRLASHLLDLTKDIFFLDEPTHFLDQNRIDLLNKFVLNESRSREKSYIIALQSHLVGQIKGDRMCEIV